MQDRNPSASELSARIKLITQLKGARSLITDEFLHLQSTCPLTKTGKILLGISSALLWVGGYGSYLYYFANLIFKNKPFDSNYFFSWNGFCFLITPAGATATLLANVISYLLLLQCYQVELNPHEWEKLVNILRQDLLKILQEINNEYPDLHCEGDINKIESAITLLAEPLFVKKAEKIVKDLITVVDTLLGDISRIPRLPANLLQFQPAKAVILAIDEDENDNGNNNHTAETMSLLRNQKSFP